MIILSVFILLNDGYFFKNNDLQEAKCTVLNRSFGKD